MPIWHFFWDYPNTLPKTLSGRHMTIVCHLISDGSGVLNTAHGIVSSDWFVWKSSDNYLISDFFPTPRTIPEISVNLQRKFLGGGGGVWVLQVHFVGDLVLQILKLLKSSGAAPEPPSLIWSLFSPQIWEFIGLLRAMSVAQGHPPEGSTHFLDFLAIVCFHPWSLTLKSWLYK